MTVEPGQPALSLTNLAVGHGKTTILSAVNLNLNPGEIIGLIGRNGAGKTTLLHSLVHLLPPLGGSILLLGQSPSDHAARRAVFHLPDGFRPPAALTGRQMLDHLAALYGRRADLDLETRIAAGLGYDLAWLRLPAGRWSKGMAQSFGLLAALTSACPVLLLDEPLDGLDPLARAAAKSSLASYAATGGAVLLSSHGLADLDRLCHRLAVIAGGHLVADSAPALLPGRLPGEDLETAILRLIAA